MGDRERVREGSEVVMHYTLYLDDGTVADTSREGEPMRFCVGDGSLLPGLERLLLGLEEGEQVKRSIAPEEGFGYPDPEAVHPVARGDFPPDVAPEPGLVIGFTTPGGEEVAGTVLEVSPEEVLVDFSHPLAGITLELDAEILHVGPPAP